MNLCNHVVSENSKIAIMPDVHAGAGCTIGTTMTITDKVVPNLVGVDIGCGMLTEPIEVADDIDWIKDLDHQIKRSVPSGQNIRKTNHELLKHVALKELKCLKHINLDRAEKSLGTLGGGNHFIEVNQDSKGRYYMVIHSGSRYLGKQVAEYYQKLALERLVENDEVKQTIAETIKDLKAKGMEKQISHAIAKIKSTASNQVADKDLAYLTDQDMQDYLHDMGIVQTYAYWNRIAMFKEIIRNVPKIKAAEQSIDYCRFTTIHNYIDLKTMTLRKGAVSAQKEELLLIPLNMRDGSIIARGKGNPDWNQSAPHGAGRLMSRSKAKQEIDLELFEESMKGIYTTSVCESTIDESCFAYKDVEDILKYIGDSVEVLEIIKPIYNFKAH